MTKCACCGNFVAITNKFCGPNKDHLVCIGCTDKIERIFAKELDIEDVKSFETDPMLIQDIELMRKGILPANASGRAKSINNETIIWAIIILITLVIAFVKSESILLIAAFPFCIFGIISFRSKENKPVSTLVKSTVKKVIFIGIVCFLCRHFVYLSPLLAGFNYKGDIADLKKWHSERFYFFPDTIPKEAKQVIKWTCTPKNWRGLGTNQQLIFYADKDYLQKIYNTYANTTTVYPYLEDHYCWGLLKDLGRDEPDLFPAPAMPFIPDQEGSELMVIHENTQPDPDCCSYGGICINWEKGFICFWEYD